MTSTDPNLHAIAAQTFRVVRKGYDTGEVHLYLKRIDAVVARLTLAAAAVPDGARARHADTDESTGPLVTPRSASGGTGAPELSAGPVPTDADVAARRAEVAELAERQQALIAWFGEDGRPDPASVPAAVAEAAQRADALVHEAQVQVDEMLRNAEAQVPTGGGDRWADLGEHVARILARAEHEARGLRTAAERDRAAASAAVEQAQQQATAMVEAAERAADELRLEAEPRARAHVAEVLADGRSQVEELTASLRHAHAQLEVVHFSVGRTLDARPPMPAVLGTGAFIDGASDDNTASDPDPASGAGTVPHRGPESDGTDDLVLDLTSEEAKVGMVEIAGSTARADAAWETFLSAGSEAVAADGRLLLDEATSVDDADTPGPATPKGRSGRAGRRRNNRS